VTIWTIRQNRSEVETLRKLGIFKRVNSFGAVDVRFTRITTIQVNTCLSQNSVGGFGALTTKK